MSFSPYSPTVPLSYDISLFNFRMMLSLLWSSKSIDPLYSCLKLVKEAEVIGWALKSSFSLLSWLILLSSSWILACNSYLSRVRPRFCFSNLLLLKISSSLCSSASCTLVSSCLSLKSKSSVFLLYWSLWLAWRRWSSCSRSFILSLYFFTSCSYWRVFSISFLLASLLWSSLRSLISLSNLVMVLL